jgi:polyribonucleotide nucleotidyltransferase
LTDFFQSTEFEIDRDYVGRVVGAQGAGVNKLRDQLGVKVDVSDDFDEKESSGKKKKVAHQKSKVKASSFTLRSVCQGCFDWSSRSPVGRRMSRRLRSESWLKLKDL